MDLFIKQAIEQMALINPIPPGNAWGKGFKSNLFNGLFKNKVNRNFKLSSFVGLLLAVFLMLTCLSACSKAELTDAEYVQSAKAYQDKGELKAAVIELKNALLQNPDNTEARLLLGTVYVELGDSASAEKELRRAQELGVSREGIVIPLAESLLLQGKYGQIIAEIQPQGSLSISDKAQVHALRGKAYIGDGELEQAAEAFRVAFELEPNLTSAQTGQARLASIRGNMEEARNWIDKALASNPESAEAWSLLGNIELTAGNAAEAEAAFSSAIKLRKDLGSDNIDIARRALARIQLEKYPEAEADIQTLKQGGFKDHPYVNYIAGISYFNQKKYPEAAEVFQASYEKRPSLPVEFYLATTHHILGNQQQAHDFAERVQAEAPRSATAKRLLGAIEISLSEYDAATEVLHESLLKSPDDVITLRMLATVSLLKDDTAQGVKYYQRIVSLEPESQQAKDMLMMAKLIHGQTLDQNVADGLGQAYIEGDDFTREFLYALEAFRDGKLGQALERAQKLHERDPTNVEPLKLMASCYLAAAQWDKARIELEKVLAIQPNEPSAARNLAIVEVQEGNLERARALLKALVDKHKGDEQAILLLADIETRLGDQAVGTQVLEQALERNPNASALRAKLAQQYFRAGQINKVLEVTRDLSDKQLQAQPSLVELRGKAQMSAGDLASSRRTFQRWTEVAPESVQAHFHYADSLTKSGEIDLARKELERVVQLDPDYVPARVGEIKVLVHAGEMESAKKALGKLRRDFGPRPEVLGIEGWFALGTKDYATAADRFSAIEEQNRDTETTILLVRSLWMQEKHDEAIDVMQTWLKGHPQDVAVLLHLAGAYLTLNKEEEAIPLYARVVEILPNHLSALNNLAWLSRDKDLKQAIGYAERAYQLSPDGPYVLDTYGVLLLKNGDTLRGHRMIQKAAEHLPEDLKIQLHLGRALVQQEQFAEAQSVLSAVVNKASDRQSAQEAKALLESIPQQ
jgi:putative PEP-CTERM system TPR-repeat lipoprotein